MKITTPTLTQEAVTDAFVYSPDTGIVSWRKRKPHKNKVNGLGHADKQGYLSVGFKGRQYSLHRLIWLYVYGYWPKGEIDHINGNNQDNRLCNLREVSPSENQHNRRICKNNKSGFAGVSFDKQTGRWYACITVNSRRINLGRHSSPEAASDAYLKAKSFYHPTAP